MMIWLSARGAINKVSFQPVVYHTGADASLLLRPRDVEAVLQSIPLLLREAETLGVTTNLGYCSDKPMLENANSMQNVFIPTGESEHPLLGHPCYEPRYTIAIRPDGGIDPFLHVRGDGRSNLRVASLKELWTGTCFSGFREHITSGRMLKECAKCCTVGVIGNSEMNKIFREDLYAAQSQGMESALRPLILDYGDAGVLQHGCG